MPYCIGDLNRDPDSRELPQILNPLASSPQVLVAEDPDEHEGHEEFDADAKEGFGSGGGGGG